MNNTMLEGQLTRWNDDRGFGFISSEDSERDVFIHISALKTMSRRPVVGDIIFYQTEVDNKGKTRAVNASIEGVEVLVPKKEQTAWYKSPWFYAVLFALVLLFAYIIYAQPTAEDVSNSSSETETLGSMPNTDGQ